MKRDIKSTINFIPLELPGRGRRFNENLLRDRKAAINDYFSQIRKLRTREPYLIYGHSMGATLGLSVANKMESIGDSPEAFIASGNPGPGIMEKEPVKRYQLNDWDFKEMLRKLGGVSDEVLENEDLYNFYSPIMRADFELLEKDGFLEQDLKIKAPIYAIMGAEEKTVSLIENWMNFTLTNFKFKIVPGNHFFIYDHSKELASIIQSFSTCFVSLK